MSDDKSNIPTYEVREQAHFAAELRKLVLDTECADEILRTTRFLLSHFPESGTPVGTGSPLPLYSLHIGESPRNSPLLVYYTYGKTRVVLIGVEINHRG